MYVKANNIRLRHSLGHSPDHCSEWEQKLTEVRRHLRRLLPARAAHALFDYYSSHADARRGLRLESREGRIYRKLIEFEETLLLWEEMKVGRRLQRSLPWIFLFSEALSSSSRRRRARTRRRSNW